MCVCVCVCVNVFIYSLGDTSTMFTVVSSTSLHWQLKDNKNKIDVNHLKRAHEMFEQYQLCLNYAL